MNRTTLALHLWGCRERLALRRDDLARRVGCSEEQIRRIERGISRPSVDLLETMIPLLDMTPAEEAVTWVTLAVSHLPDRIRQRVEVHRAGTLTKATDAAVEWVEMNLELSEEDERFLRTHVEQRLKL